MYFYNSLCDLYLYENKHPAPFLYFISINLINKYELCHDKIHCTGYTSLKNNVVEYQICNLGFVESLQLLLWLFYIILYTFFWKGTLHTYIGNPIRLYLKI